MTVPTEETSGERRAQRVARRAKIEHQIEAPQHRTEPLSEIVGDAIEQKGLRSRGHGAATAHAQQAGDRKSAGLAKAQA